MLGACKEQWDGSVCKTRLGGDLGEADDYAASYINHIAPTHPVIRHCHPHRNEFQLSSLGSYTLHTWACSFAAQLLQNPCRAAFSPFVVDTLISVS